MQELKDDFEKSGGEWKEYKICGDDGIFHVRNTHSIQQSWIKHDSGDYPYVTASEANNSVISHISYDADFLEEGNSIMIGGKTLVVTYQENDYFSNDSHNLALYIKDERGKSEKSQLFLVSALYKSLKPKYSWGDSISYKKIQKDTITLPTKDGKIDFDFMEAFIRELEEERIRELEEERIRELAAYLKACGFDDYADKTTDNNNWGGVEKTLNDFRAGKVIWKEFALGELFAGKTGDVDLQQTDINGKGVRFVNSGIENCGIKGFTDRAARTFPTGTITIDFWGYAFYRDFEYKMATHNHVFSLSGECIKNKEVGLFLVGAMSKLKNSCSYSAMGTWKRFKNMTISLPVTSVGEIDFGFMQDFIVAQERQIIKNVVAWKDKIIEKTKEIVR